jgi:hypothetical protein
MLSKNSTTEYMFKGNGIILSDTCTFMNHYLQQPRYEINQDVH